MQIKLELNVDIWFSQVKSENKFKLDFSTLCSGLNNDWLPSGLE